jgi:serine/threonine protein kinase
MTVPGLGNQPVDGADVSESPPHRQFPYSPAASGKAVRRIEETDSDCPTPPSFALTPVSPVRADQRDHDARPGVDFPAQIGPYRLVRELARGGMGDVYLGIDEALNRRVAVKVMAKDLIRDNDAMVRFQREARAAASVTHPNIAMVYLVGVTDDGAPYLAMEYVEGGSLEGIIRGKARLPFSRVVEIMKQTAEGLSAAHRKAIIHRDIKPGNIMLAGDGTVKIVDFGLAKVIHEDSYRTVAGTVMGTPRYMAPEQTQGREVDFRADIYSLGATFYHVLAGKSPFDGDNPTQIMLRHVTAPVVPLRNINPEVPIELDDFIRRCLAKDPNGRFQDYMDLIGDLGKLQVQFMARERGSLVSSLSDLPTMRLGQDGMPIPPGGSPNRSRDQGTLREDLEADSAASESSAGWRYALMGGGLLIAVAAVVLALFIPRAELEPPPATGEPTGRTGLQVLIERLASQARTEAPTAPPPDPDHLAYLATREIAEELGRALFTFSVEQDRRAESIAELAGSGAAVRLFDTNARGVPLDGWGRPLDYARGQQAIISMGLDGRPNTGDDITADSEGNITIQDMTVYDELEERDRRRTGNR